MNEVDPPLAVWVVDRTLSTSCLERLGDARRLADRMGAGVGVLLFEEEDTSAVQGIHHGADLVCLIDRSNREFLTAQQGAEIVAQAIRPHQPKILFAGTDPGSREWGAWLAVQQDWLFVHPTLIVDWRGGRLAVTRLDPTERRSARLVIDASTTVIVTMRPGVAEPCPADTTRQGEISHLQWTAPSDSSVKVRFVPGDPAQMDIRHVDRLVSGGRGLGDRSGFELLGRFADSFQAGLAASRMAVDLGWIDFERQVGQTGKTVEPDIYIACGISGASHHLEGMSQATHIVAINTDPEAPIFRVAHLGLVADLHQVLSAAQKRLEDR